VCDRNWLQGLFGKSFRSTFRGRKDIAFLLHKHQPHPLRLRPNAAHVLDATGLWTIQFLFRVKYVKFIWLCTLHLTREARMAAEKTICWKKLSIISQIICSAGSWDNKNWWNKISIICPNWLQGLFGKSFRSTFRGRKDIAFLQHKHQPHPLQLRPNAAHVLDATGLWTIQFLFRVKYVKFIWLCTLHLTWEAWMAAEKTICWKNLSIICQIICSAGSRDNKNWK
jgi:hypothetical protein